MTTDFEVSAGVPASSDLSREAAIAASSLQHAEGVRVTAGLRLVDAGWQDHSPVYFDAVDVLTRSVSIAALHKNVPVLPRYYADVARMAVQQFTDDEMVALLALDPAAVNKAQFALSHALDELAATIVANLAVRILGNDNPPQHIIAQIVEAHLAEIAREGAVVVWPDLMETAIKYTSAGASADA